ncbi:hypothetical protein HMPREF1214_03731 [Bacteroides sp. HPS0048]|uniref:hypothetical protein n=1 Tax=unclassified Bacteroides TaxID=2646097 RepID=UPI0003711D2A|nr:MULTISPECIES: hypothetical protein [unclassified Bacteroides]EOA55608.1 hypothetical protein HMPREF1214_03731 [Bacteroides sp. HPS0048]
MAHPDCIGNCRKCTVLGACPSDLMHCEDCGEEIGPGEGIEIEVEAVDHGRHGTKMITVCVGCYEALYQNEMIEDNF